MQDYLIVLVNGAGALPLTRALVLDVYGMIPAEFRTRFGWLDPGEAAELGFSVGSPAEAKVIASFIGEELVKHRVDCALVPAQGRRKKLLIADMESTMIGCLLYTSPSPRD